MARAVYLKESFYKEMSHSITADSLYNLSIFFLVKPFVIMERLSLTKGHWNDDAVWPQSSKTAQLKHTHVTLNRKTPFAIQWDAQTADSVSVCC